MTTGSAGHSNDEDVAVLLDERRDHRLHAVQQAGDVELLGEDRHPTGFDLGQIEDVVDEHELVLGRLVDLRQVGDVGVIAEVFGLFGEQLAVADDGVQWCPQFVGHAGQELGLVAGGDFQRLVGFLQFVEQPGVLDSNDGLVSEGFQRGQSLWSLNGRMSFRASSSPPTLLLTAEDGPHRKPRRDFVKLIDVGVSATDIQLGLRPSVPHTCTGRPVAPVRPTSLD